MSEGTISAGVSTATTTRGASPGESCATPTLRPRPVVVIVHRGKCSRLRILVRARRRLAYEALVGATQQSEEREAPRATVDRSRNIRRAASIAMQEEWGKREDDSAGAKRRSRE